MQTRQVGEARRCLTSMEIFMEYLTGIFQNNKYIWFYLTGINVITFVIFGLDKAKAVKGKWRISEAVLLSFSFIGGSIGGILAMKTFNHKTKKIYFSLGLPIMLLIHIVIILYVNPLLI